MHLLLIIYFEFVFYLGTILLVLNMKQAERYLWKSNKPYRA